jgi:hypothetical protein
MHRERIKWHLDRRLLLRCIPVFLCMLAFRLGHVDVLWVDEAYPLAAAWAAASGRSMLAGFHAALVAGAAVYWWRNRDGTAARNAEFLQFDAEIRTDCLNLKSQIGIVFPELSYI